MCTPQLGDGLAISVLSITFNVFLIALHMHWPQTLSPLTFNTYLAALFGTFRFLCAYLLACMHKCVFITVLMYQILLHNFCTLDSAYLVKATCKIYLRCIAVTDSKSFHQTIRKVIQLSILLPENQNSNGLKRSIRLPVSELSCPTLALTSASRAMKDVQP